MRVYESVIIINSSLHEDTLNRIVSHCEDIITKNGGKLLVTNKWGKRRLAYPINKFQYGYYILFEFEAPPHLIGELEREYRLNENILRFMTIHKDKRAILAEQRRKEKEEEMAKEVTADIEEKPESSEEASIEVVADVEIEPQAETEPALETEPTGIQEPEGESASTEEFDFQEKTEESKPEESGDTAAEPEETAEDTRAEETEEEKTNASGDDPEVSG